MYEIVLNCNEKKKFILNARIKMLEREWSMADLARAINRPVSSVYSFFSSGSNNRYMAAEIAHALNMRKRDWKI